MKTTEELRKEIEQLRREEYDACLDFSHKIKPLEAQLKLVDEGDLLFEDVQLQSKLAYVNDLFSNRGIPFVLARKSDLLEYVYNEETNHFYKQLALFHRSEYKGIHFTVVYTFDPAKSCEDLFEQIHLVEQQFDFLDFLCYVSNDFPFLFKGVLGGEVSFVPHALVEFLGMDTHVIVSYDKVADRYTIRITDLVDWFCKGEIEIPTTKNKEVKAMVGYKGVDKLTLTVSKDDVRSVDLKSALEELKVRLLELNETGKDKVTVQLTLVTE